MRYGSIELMPHQIEALDKFRAVKSVIVGDDTGTGKTVTTIALVEQMWGLGEVGPCLIITKSFREWTNHLSLMGVEDSRIHVIDKRNRSQFVNDLVELQRNPIACHYFIMHWEALVLVEETSKIRWMCVAGDEAHKAKNRKAQRTKALKKIRSAFKIAVTATPGDNLNQDVWSVLNWLYPSQYTSYWRWVDKYIEYETHWKGYKIFHGPKMDMIPEFLEEIDPFYIARPLSVVDDSVPPYRYSTVFVQMDAEQEEAYKSLVDMQLALLPDGDVLITPTDLLLAQRLQQVSMARTYIEVRQKWIWKKKRQVVNGVNEFVDERVKVPYDSVRLTTPSPKLDMLEAILAGNYFRYYDRGMEDQPLQMQTSIDTDEPIVIFTQFRDMVDMIVSVLTNLGIPFVSVKGGNSRSEEDPDSAAHLFQSGKVRVLVGTVDTISESITLTRSHIEIFVDCPWSPRVRKQAEGRIGRIGQLREPWVIDIKTRGTVDEVRLDRVRTKKQWLDAMFGRDWD